MSAADRRDDRRQAAWFLLNYAVELASYRNRKAEFLARPADENAGRRGKISRPTEAAALASIAYDVKNPVYYWLCAVEQIEKELPAIKREFLSLRREAQRRGSRSAGRGRRAWIAFMQGRLGRWLSEAAIKRRWYEIVDLTIDRHLRLRLRAAEKRLIDGA